MPLLLLTEQKHDIISKSPNVRFDHGMFICFSFLWIVNCKVFFVTRTFCNCSSKEADDVDEVSVNLIFSFVLFTNPLRRKGGAQPLILSGLSDLFNVFCDQVEGPIPTDHETKRVTNSEWTQDSSRREVDKALAPSFTMQYTDCLPSAQTQSQPKVYF